MKLGLGGNTLQGESFYILGWKSEMCEFLGASVIYKSYQRFMNIVKDNNGMLPKGLIFKDIYNSIQFFN